MTVLIVDDSPQVRALIRTIVTGLADDVTECADGDEAVAMYGARRRDWVLMDFKMPRMGGLEATRRILAADPAARVLIVTDYDDVHWRAAASEAGACGYVLKENLLDVRRLLTRRDDCSPSERPLTVIARKITRSMQDEKITARHMFVRVARSVMAIGLLLGVTLVADRIAAIADRDDRGRDGSRRGRHADRLGLGQGARRAGLPGRHRLRSRFAAPTAGSCAPFR